MSFKEEVLKVVAKIPSGQTLSYQEVVQQAGWPRAYRAVGNILRQNSNTRIPCHRVIRSDGRPGGYNRGPQLKARLLKKEKAI